MMSLEEKHRGVGGGDQEAFPREQGLRDLSLNAKWISYMSELHFRGRARETRPVRKLIFCKKFAFCTNMNDRAMAPFFDWGTFHQVQP